MYLKTETEGFWWSCFIDVFLSIFLLTYYRTTDIKMIPRRRVRQMY